MNMHLNPDELRIAMFQLFVQYMVFHAIQVWLLKKISLSKTDTSTTQIGRLELFIDLRF